LGTISPYARPRHRLLVFGLLTALTLVSSWPLLRQFGTALPSDLGDSILNSWIFWWNAHHVPLTAAWWNAPMFAPMPGTFALSETMMSLLPVTSPLQWLGVNPIAAHNAAYLLSYPMAGLGAYLLAFRLTRRWDASLIAALAFAFNPYRIAQLPHIQVQWSCWMPLALAALHDYLDKRRSRALAVFGMEQALEHELARPAVAQVLEAVPVEVVLLELCAWRSAPGNLGP